MRLFAPILLVCGLLVGASVVLATSVQTAEFVGARTCGGCHPSAYQVWKRTPHARAYRALPQGHLGDLRCMRCHGTGDGEFGSVQCEYCHGPGRYYARRHVMKDPQLSRIVGLVDVSDGVCRRCHTDTAPSVQAFDRERMWGFISHGREERSSRASE